MKTDGVWKEIFRIRKVQERNLVLPCSPRTQQQVQEKGKGWVTASFALRHYSNCLREHIQGGSSRQAASGYLDRSRVSWFGKTEASYSSLLLIQHYAGLLAMVQPMNYAVTSTINGISCLLDSLCENDYFFIPIQKC